MMICCCSLAGTKACENCSRKINEMGTGQVTISNYPNHKWTFIPYVNINTNTGWICPRCKKVNAPTKTECDCKEDND
jgi:hypothetical protein